MFFLVSEIIKLIKSSMLVVGEIYNTVSFFISI